MGLISGVRSRIGAKAKAWLGTAYDLHGETLRLDRLAGRFTDAPLPVNDEYELALVDGSVPDISFLVATTNAGLLFFDGPRARRLFRGRDFFGLSTHGGRWYTYQRMGIGNGYVFSFRLEDGLATDSRVEVAGLMRGVHQIDFIDGALWIVDTFQDRLLAVPVDFLGADWRDHSAAHYPVGRDKVGRDQPNHVHFNSILGRDGTVYVIAHNHSAETGRDSELFLLDPDGTVRGRERLGAKDCHNIGLIDGERIICHSVDGTVTVGGREVLRLGGYVRGLALGDDYHVVGTSTIDSFRARRADGNGQVMVTDRAFRPVATMVIPSTQIYEIRRVDAPDLGLSASNPPVVAAAH